MAKFNGGTSCHSNGGYLKFTAGPLRDQFVHIVIAEAMLGRKLKGNEHVHHKDGDTKNPHPSNLLVLKDDLHNSVSRRQYWYLNQLFSQEEAAWRAFLDVTGKDVRQISDISFDPATFS